MNSRPVQWLNDAESMIRATVYRARLTHPTIVHTELCSSLQGENHYSFITAKVLKANEIDPSNEVDPQPWDQ